MNYTAITIRQPWVEFILAGLKTVENRVWSASHRGVLLLHAARAFDDDWKKRFSSIIAQDAAIRYMNHIIIARRGVGRWQRGVIAGAVLMTGCDTIRNDRWCQNDCMYHRYREPYRFKKAVECRGMQKLFQPKLTNEMLDPLDAEELRRMQDLAVTIGLSRKEEK